MGAGLVALMALAVAGGGARLRGEGPAAAPNPERVATGAVSAPADPAPDASRVVTDTKEAALPRARASGWTRDAPRAPLGPSAVVPLVPDAIPGAAPPLPPPPDPTEPKPTLLFQPVATASGRIQAAGHVVELEGVEVLDPAARCEGDAGAWPCGAIARAAFRAWLRGRAVECTVAAQPSATPVVSSCRLGKQDAAAWLVGNGLAAALPGGAYEQAGAEARAARRGIYGDRPARVSVVLGAGGGILPDLEAQVGTPAPVPAPGLSAAPEPGHSPSFVAPSPPAAVPATP